MNRLNNPLRGSKIEILLMLGLLLAFAMTTFVIVIIGADQYQKTVEDMEESFTLRAPLDYVGMKVRQNNSQDNISIEEKEGKKVLIVKEDIEGITYETWIYHYKEGLYELFVEAGTNLPLQNGMEIMKVEKFEIKNREDRFLEIKVTHKNNKNLSLILALRGKG